MYEWSNGMSLTEQQFNELTELAIKTRHNSLETPKNSANEFRKLFLKYYCEDKNKISGFKEEYGVYYFDKILNKDNRLLNFSDEEIKKQINDSFDTNFSYTPSPEFALELFKQNHPLYRTFTQANTDKIILVPVSKSSTIHDIKKYIAKNYYKQNQLPSSICIADGKEIIDEKKLCLHMGELANDRVTVGSIILLDQYENKPDKFKLDLSKQYRVWFSKTPDVFLPPVEKAIIETSIELNPHIKTHLIVNSELLSDYGKLRLKKWGENNNCEIIDIANFTPASELDKLIFEIIKLELENWIDGNKLGNPGLASDLARLLFIDQGVYIDCDILTYENIPKELKVSQFALTSFLDIPTGAVNNDMMAFSCEQGRIQLNDFKQQVVNNYFGKSLPNLQNLPLVMNKRKQECQNLSEQKLKKYISKLVTNISGPYALKSFCQKQNPPLDNLESDIMNYWQHLHINASTSFDKLNSAGFKGGGLTWLPGAQIENIDRKKLSDIIPAFKEHLKTLSEQGTKNLSKQQQVIKTHT